MSCSIEFDRILRKAEDVAAEGNNAGGAPRLQHGAVFADLVLPLLGVQQVGGVDGLQADEHAPAAGAPAFLDEVRDLVGQRIDLDQEAERDLLALAQVDDAIENGFPLPVAREIVVGDEEPRHALGQMRAQQLLDVVGAAVARLAALHIDDRAEAALERAAAPGIERADRRRIAPQPLRRQIGRDGALQPRQVGENVVDRLQPIGERVLQQRVDQPLGLAREQRHAEVDRRLQIPRQFIEHRQAAADVKAADHHLQPARPQFARHVHGARKLVALHADQEHHAVARPGDARGHTVGRDQRVALVPAVEAQRDVGAEHAAFGGVHDDREEAGQRVRRDRGFPPLDDVAVVIVVRGLDHLDVERAHHQSRPRMNFFPQSGSAPRNVRAPRPWIFRRVAIHSPEDFGPRNPPPVQSNLCQ